MSTPPKQHWGKANEAIRRIEAPHAFTPEFMREVKDDFSAIQHAPVTREQIADARCNGLAGDVYAYRKDQADRARRRKRYR